MTNIFHLKSTCIPASIYLILEKSSNSNSPQYIRVNNNSISILDLNGKIIKQVFIDAKTLPISIPNDQINQRSLINHIDNFIKGMNLSLFFIGASNSGKQRLFDGNRGQNSVVYYFVNYVLPMLKKKFRKLEVRMKMVVCIKEKMYDCLSDNRYFMVKNEENSWEGITLPNATNVIIENSEDFLNEIQRGVKNKNKLILEYKQLYTGYLTVEFIHQNPQNQASTIISKLNVFQIPGVQILGQSHSNAKVKQSSSSVKSLLNFTSILQEYAKNQDYVPYTQNSILSSLTKQVIGANSLISTFFTFKIDDNQGSLATIKFIKPFNSLKQYPIINQSNSFGLLRKFRAEAMNKNRNNTGQEKQYIENEVMRLQTQQDYQRVIQKYTQLKQKFNKALKDKSQAQLQLIKCQEQKIQIGKVLVEVQIQNTKLLQKLQNKDYQNGKKMLNVENKLVERQLSTQQLREKIHLANQSLNQALETKRDLQVEFIALKRNFILVKKQSEKLKQDNQNLSLDLINITNMNQKLKQQILLATNNQDGNKSSFYQKKSIIIEMEEKKMQQIKRENKAHQQTIEYLKSQVERFKKELIQTQMNHQFKGNKQNGSLNGSNAGKDYERIEMESQNMQLANRLKLKQRKIDQLQQKLAFYEDQHENLQNQLRQFKIQNHNQTQQYRKRLEQILKNTNYQQVVKEMKENFMRKDTENFDKINSMKKDFQQSKRQKAQLRQYVRQLRTLLEEWAPKGASIPQINKFLNMDLGEGQNSDMEALRIKNRRLQEQIRRIKEGNFTNSSQFRQSRVKQEYDYLKGNSSLSNPNVDKLQKQNNALLQENRRLTILLKDGNKMDLNIIKKQNQTLKKQLSQLRSSENQFQKTSVSPSTINNDQKIVFYEKHIKKIEKQRSQLLSRCVVAQEQVKNMLEKVANGKR